MAVIPGEEIGWIDDDDLSSYPIVCFPQYSARGSHLRSLSVWRRGALMLLVKAANLLISAALLLLAACHQTPPATPSDRVVTVQVPVSVQPITKAQIPPLPGPIGPRPADARDAADQALAARCDAIAFVIRAYPLLLHAAGVPLVQAPDYPECDKR